MTGSSDDDWLALGLTLRLLTSPEGGRSKDLGVPGSDYVRYQYRPNWGLPGMSGTEQVGALVLWLGHFPVHLGDTVRAVIVPFAPESIELWRTVRPGDELAMFEGTRICGRATVEMTWSTARSVPEQDERRFIDWAEDLDGDQ